jgi:hypothetical protein
MKVEVEVMQHTVAQVDERNIDFNASICVSCGGTALIICVLDLVI